MTAILAGIPAFAQHLFVICPDPPPAETDYERILRRFAAVDAAMADLDRVLGFVPEPARTRRLGHRVHAPREAQRLTPGRAREVRRG